MNILLLGKDGQVGWELQRSLAPLGSLTALGRADADLADLDQLAQVVHAYKPAIIVNAAAYTAVDKAESEPLLARTVNASAPEVLANIATELGAWLIHYSTDYVFNGRGEKPFSEIDATGPLSVYGQTKLEGEQAVSRWRKYLIFRTSWVYAARGGNFAKTMLRLAQEKDQLKVVADQIGAPTGAELIADVTAHALRSVLNNENLAGIYHLCARGETSWYDYACHVIEFARRAGVPIKLGPDAVSGIPSEEYPTPAQRPRNSRLCTDKLESLFRLQLPHWKAGVERMLTETLVL